MDVRLDEDGVLQVEPTDRCNLACAMCAPQVERRGAPHGIPAGAMDPALLARIAEGIEASDVRFDHVILQWMGEPALHPALPTLVGTLARALRGRARYLRLDTNAVTLDPPRLDALVDAWLPVPDLPLLLVFSLDAATAATYRRVKGGDHLDRARRNIRHVVDRRARLPQGTPLNLQFQFVVQEGNADEAPEFLRYWRQLLACRARSRGHDEVLYKRLSVAAGGPGQAAADALYDATLERFGIRPGPHGPVHVVTWDREPWTRDDSPPPASPGPRRPCPGPWMTPVVRHDGLLSPCCVDLRGELGLGSLRERTFAEAWRGPEALALRLAHVTGDLSAFPLCAGCGGIGWYGFPDATVEAWLHGVGRADLVPAWRHRMAPGP